VQQLRVLLAVLSTLALFTPGAANAAPAALGLHLTPCTQGHSKVPAECGTFGVYENRAAHSGRIIALKVILLKAQHPSNRAVAMIAGGPGEPVTPFAQYVADGQFLTALTQLRDRYNILFVDDRGMGGSHPFTCDFAPPGDATAYFAQLYPTKLVRDCRSKSTLTMDPAQYNTNNTVDDLDDVRAALRYPKLVLDGGSYGTFFSLVYVRRHSRHVQSVVLDSVDPPHFQAVPGSPDGAQTALDDLVVKCRHDPTCRKTFPAFRSHFNAVMQRFDAGTVAVSAKNLVTKRAQTVQLSKEVLVDSVRHALYDPDSAAYIPYIIERAYVRDYEPLSRLVEFEAQSNTQDVNPGANLSYSCADWLPFITGARLEAAAAHSFAGDLRARAEQAACKMWNVPTMPPSFDDPVRSDLPVLMISASDDPATPPALAEAALHYLPNGRQVLVTGGGHSTFTPCTDRLTVAFVRRNSAKGLNLSECTSSFKLPPFAMSMKGFPEL